MALRDIDPRLEEFRETSRRRLADQTRAPGLLAILWRRKLVILASLLLFVISGAIYLSVTPPRYQATSTILIDPRLGKVVGTDPVQPGFVTDAGAMDSQIKLFTSQTVLSRVAKMADLADDPEFNGSDRSLLQRLLHPKPQLLDAVDLTALEDAITVKRPERTYVIEIDVLARDAKKAAAIANDVVQAYIDDQVSSRVDSARDDAQFVRQKLDKLSTQISAVDDKIEAYKTQNNIVDANGLRSNEQQVADLMRSLSQAQAKTSDARARLVEIDRLAHSGHLDATTPALNSLTIERLRQQQADADESVARLAMTLGPRHPELLEAKARAAKAARLIHDELERIEMDARSTFNSDRANERQIQAQVDALKTQSNELGRKLVPLEQLQRTANVLRSSFARFSQVNDNIAQQEADSPPGRIISVARPPVSPARPKKALTMLIAGAAGLFFGVAAALFFEGSEPLPAGGSRLPRGPSAYGTHDTDGPVTSVRPPPPPPPPPPVGRRPVRRYWDDDDMMA